MCAHLPQAGIVTAAAHSQAAEARQRGDGRPALGAHARDALQAEAGQLRCGRQRAQAARAQLVRLRKAMKITIEPTKSKGRL